MIVKILNFDTHLSKYFPEKRSDLKTEFVKLTIE